MNTKLQIAFFILGGIIALIYATWIFVTERRLQRFFLGKKAKDLEDTILALEEDIASLKKAKKEIEGDIVSINSRLKKSIQGLEMIRFNPFPDQGSNQSFAISMLNEEKSGVVLSSLYSRDRMSIFAKPIKNGKSEYELTTEEKEVLDKAKTI